MSEGKLIVLSAPSGTGKTSVCKELLKRNPNWTFSISVTTREPREGEVDGIDYIFMEDEKFKHMAHFGDFIEWEWVHGNKYGTLMSTLDDSLDEGKIMLLDIDVKGGKSITEEFPDEVISIFIEPPGDNITEKKEVLEERLKLRANTPITLIKKRLKRLDLELEYKDNFQHHFINYDLEETTNDIENIIKENLNK
ncbi:MAG: guanylate kinase [Candidatus Marinimicrobia bacterium]|nr:guanylate kinase [Candidatus Neomarinimicrobiota bacterium]